MDRELEQKQEVVQKFLDKRFLELKLNDYRAYCAGEDSQGNEFDIETLVEWEDLNPQLRFFEEMIDYSRYGDGIGCGIHQMKISDVNTVIYRFVTDGDDGWIIVFDENGTLLASGYTYIELIEWDVRSVVDGQSNNIEALISFQPRTMHGETFWGKPLAEAETIAAVRLNALL